jgi:hypothetical protein
MLFEREQKMYQEFLAEETPWVLVVTGMGGSGKSMLLDCLRKQTPDDTFMVTLNFKSFLIGPDPLNVIYPLRILGEFARQVETHCEEQQINIFKKTLEHNLNLLTQTPPQMIQMIYANQAQVSGPRFDMSGFDILRDIRYGMRALVTEAFYAQMHTFNLPRLVIMLDNCELLHEAHSLVVGQWIMNELLPELHTRMAPKCRCYVVMADSVPLQPGVIDRQHQKLHDQLALDPTEIEQCLRSIGVQGQDHTLIQSIFDITYGHRFCVSIICDLWQRRSLLSFDELTIPFQKQVLEEVIYDRIINRLPSPFRELTRYGVLLRSFNFSLLRAVFSHLELNPDQFDQFTRLYPHIIFVGNYLVGNYRHACHDLLRSVLAEVIWQNDHDAWQLYHKRALDYLGQSSPHPVDWYYHALAYDGEKGMLEWLQAVREAQTDEQRDTLLSLVLDKALKFTPVAHAAQQIILSGSLGRSKVGEVVKNQHEPRQEIKDMK